MVACFACALCCVLPQTLIKYGMRSGKMTELGRLVEGELMVEESVRKLAAL